MNNIFVLILIASFATIGDVDWLRTFVAAVKLKKVDGWLWPLITFFVAIFVGIAVAQVDLISISPETAPLPKSVIGLEAMFAAVTLATIQLGYKLVVKTFLDILGGISAWFDKITGQNSPPTSST